MTLYDFLLVFHYNHFSIWYRFGNTVTYLSKFKKSQDSKHTPFVGGG